MGASYILNFSNFDLKDQKWNFEQDLEIFERNETKGLYHKTYFGRNLRFP